MIGIIDYGMGNLGSVANALEHLSHPAEVTSDPASLEKYDRLILPGVGSFAKAMANLSERGWPAALKASVGAGRPLLGICLGMQLLFDRGEEHGDTEGLGLIPGAVKLMQPGGDLVLPHVGWNSLVYARKHPLFAGVKEQVDVYFVHSFHCIVADAADVVARCDYGGLFVAGVARGPVAGMQYHPEKSQPAGLKMLENFVGWDGA